MRVDRKTCVLAVAAAVLLLAAGAWPHDRLPVRDLNGHQGYFWHADGEDRISLADAGRQAQRVARERNMRRNDIENLIAQSTRNDTYNFAEPVEVDVSELNDRLDGRK